LNYQHIQLFQNVNATDLTNILSAFTHLHLRDGELLIAAGQNNHHLFLLLDGQMRARLTDDPADIGIPIATGEAIGELSIIDGQTTSANVFSDGDSHVLAIHEDDFWHQLAPLPEVMRNLTRLITRRLRLSSEHMIRAFEEQLRYEHLKKELATAREIQMGLLPHHTPLLPLHPQAEINAILLPAKEIGGDLFDAFAIDEEHILFAVGDVSGKGMAAAMFMMRTLTLLRTHGKAKMPCQQLMPTLNRLLCEGNEACMFVTLNIAVLSVRSGHLVLFNGGHPPPFLSRQGGAFEPVIGAKGALLGVLPEAVFKCHELILQAGDRILLYSDGVTEAENINREMYLPLRAQAALDAQPQQVDMKQLVNHLVEDVQQFAAGADQSDDITVLAMRFGGQPGLC